MIVAALVFVAPPATPVVVVDVVVTGGGAAALVGSATCRDDADDDDDDDDDDDENEDEEKVVVDTVGVAEMGDRNVGDDARVGDFAARGLHKLQSVPTGMVVIVGGASSVWRGDRSVNDRLLPD